VEEQDSFVPVRAVDIKNGEDGSRREGHAAVQKVGGGWGGEREQHKKGQGGGGGGGVGVGGGVGGGPQGGGGVGGGVRGVGEGSLRCGGTGGKDKVQLCN